MNGDKAMDKAAAIAAVKAAEAVYGWVRLSPEDGVYVRMVKADAVRAIREYPFDDEGGFNVRIEPTGVYLN